MSRVERCHLDYQEAWFSGAGSFVGMSSLKKLLLMSSFTALKALWSTCCVEIFLSEVSSVCSSVALLLTKIGVLLAQDYESYDVDDVTESIQCGQEVSFFPTDLFL